MARDDTNAVNHVKDMVVDLMNLFCDAVRCGAVVQTSPAFVGHTAPGSVPPLSIQDNLGVCSSAHCTISLPDAISIFVAKQQTLNRDRRLAARLATEYGITARAVRDIWNLRTWSWATRPYWTAFDSAYFASKNLNTMSRTPSPTNSTPVTAVEVDVEPKPSQEVVASADVEEGDAQSLQDEQNEPLEEQLECKDPPEYVDSLWPSTGASTTAAAEDRPVPNSHPAHTRSPRLLIDSREWLIDSAVIAQEFEVIFLAWHHSDSRRDCMEM